jgi:hypothetical protein
MLNQKQPTKAYIERNTGTRIHPNMDEASLASLLESQVILKTREKVISQSVVIRRAVRLYASYLKSLTNLDQELLLLQRAKKGVV